MVKKQKKPKNKPNKTISIAEAYGYTRKDFKRWGKMGGRFSKYYSNNPSAEAAKVYRRKKTQQQLISGEKTGIFNMKTGRVRKYANQAERQRAYRLRKKANEGK
jgi:hypothetical protein